MFAPRFEQGSLFKILDETHGLVYEREGGTQARGGSEGGHSCEFRWSKPCSGVVLVALGRAPNPFTIFTPHIARSQVQNLTFQHLKFFKTRKLILFRRRPPSRTSRSVCAGRPGVRRIAVGRHASSSGGGHAPGYASIGSQCPVHSASREGACGPRLGRLGRW